ncbi:MBL fold metallo-hydrolase [Pseudoalteromonas sp. KS88]|uniref:MBL fold metallo-hydrolase n=1 Tax=Pseudoalteromonas sp. KS88 TaxID=2109918 RepID=UPI0010800B0C|nr:MBL fold metallo-hydrolase [Pseudoalteromonas sp. KS88]TGE83232.1 MBL fold metallo-hydrolase [Pseudoalteromonas sp. KS88]
MKLILVLLSIALFSSDNSLARENDFDKRMARLAKHTWIHGSPMCEGNSDPSIEVYQFSDTTYILRQSKCSHYEAPFIYLLFGKNKVFVLDTGATSDPVTFPLFRTIESIVNKLAEQRRQSYDNLSWLVAHSHGHGDHIAGDTQFLNQPNVSLIKPNLESVKQAFRLHGNKWPNVHANVELGNRHLTIIALPGHKSDAIAVYDSETKWLLTGDSLYPGRLYVKDWEAFRNSIARLTDFSQNNVISALMGTHIEMKNTPGQNYKMGTTYQPEEAALPMSVKDLSLLNEIMQSRNSPSRVVTDHFIVYPID